MRVDGVVLRSDVGGRDIEFDSTVRHPLAVSYVEDQAHNPLYLSELTDREKGTKHRATSEHHGCEFRALGMTTFGQFSGDTFELLRVLGQEAHSNMPHNYQTPVAFARRVGDALLIQLLRGNSRCLQHTYRALQARLHEVDDVGAGD